jgi:hypothetical protein
MEKDSSKTSFIKIYSQLPDGIRKEIIVVVDKKPYTWDTAFLEIDKNTPLGIKILDKMKSMGLI